MALYQLTDEQRDALLQIVDNAQIPGRAARLVAGIQDALSRPVDKPSEQPPEDDAA